MNMNTSWLGLDLRSPIVPSASPLSESLDSIRTMEDFGAGAVVLHSLFEEQIEAESKQLHHYLELGTESYAESLDYLPASNDFRSTADAYLEHVSAASRAVDMPVIASLNGATPGGWTDHARLLEEAGASAIELNLYNLPTDLETPSNVVEDRYLAVVRLVRSVVSIPVAVKISPYITSTAHFAQELCKAGASGIVLFNRFYQPDIDIDSLETRSRVTLSSSWESRLPLRWIALLYGRIPADLAITTGIHTHEDVLKGLMAGASITMTASELLARGLIRIEEILDAMRLWMTENEYESVEQMQGSMSHLKVADTESYERANYMKVLGSWPR